jgi:hypothetical protein
MYVALVDERSPNSSVSNQEAWKECLETFGEDNVLIVSNSAGTYLDAGGIQVRLCYY